ncbi:PREDICTED: E3 ubiquitin-protein ligase RING1-like [Polistes canadensis]|uniref:E3 ubiquitin-protein ligase RING1-like n=1 Tax=Polistes canadensis TaxID=91411 RepID=UPI000718B1FF|nr:PREDICTED: E3 ubiquitin-protein ligase RING1-like [Polistes canadensis]
MRCTTVTLVATISVFALVNSYPVPQERGFRSEALERLLMIEGDKEAALRNKRTIGILRQLFPDITQDVNPEAENRDVNPEAENRVNEVGSESQNNEVRVQFADEQSANEAVPNLTPLEDVESSDDENRNKRFLNFGFGGSSGGSGAGSGNFLFDIIRQAADGAARAAGTVYRVVAGTQSLGLGLSASRDVAAAAPAAASASSSSPSSSSSSSSSTPGASSSTADASSTAAPQSAAGTQPPSMVAGSGSQSNSSGDASAGRTDGTQEAIPGPITRLFVIANRGISNLLQDLILRLAATSERIVNFKARLITSII